MNDIKELILKKENRKLEFKRELPSKDKIIKTAIAFSNSQGGNLIIGISDKNELLGIDEDNMIKFEEIISNTIYDNCVPNIMPNIYSVRVKNKTILVVHFYPSSSKPHYIKSIGKKDSSYIRVGSSNRIATQDILEALERDKRNISFDSVVNFDERYSKTSFDNISSKIEKKLDLKPNTATYEKLKFIKKAIGIAAQETAQETAQEPTRNKIISILKNNPKTTKQELMKLLDKADGTIKQHIYNLKKDGVLTRVGSTKSGYWQINEK